ncbi:hypothetical protein M0805_004233 [Coniferiporia weirii]|nr:hypothetical protein M0805_004233 [Coniferiporia weirii]
MSSLNSGRHASVRTQHTRDTRSTVRTVVTSPPWASDEPPSPSEQQIPLSSSGNSIHPRPSQSGLSTTGESTASTSNQTATQIYGQRDEPLWWMFTRKGREEGPPQRSSAARHNWPILASRSNGSPAERERDRPMKQRAMSTWLSGAQRVRQPLIEGDPDPSSDEERNRRSWGLHIPLPTPAPFTLSQNRTPGWETPWSPRVGQPLPAMNGQGSNLGTRESSPGLANGFGEITQERGRTRWYYRRKALRAFILNNTYVPLLFRVINITLTTAALAVAITIRRTETKYNILGAVGSSPIIVIIFAPLTLVHVMVAIYLEYFGRPLGLWRTSSKLIHTLSETLFVCAWSAALSLCFDNFFTSVIGCASPSSISWYNEIPRPTPDVPNLGRGEGEPGDYICDHQVALICLVFLGLIMYCSNLFISLFRIFEKVKYHIATLPR